MRKEFLIALVGLQLISLSINSQIVVDDNGHAVVGIEPSASILSPLSVNHVGTNDSEFHVRGVQNSRYRSVYVLRTATGSSISDAYSGAFRIIAQPNLQNYGLMGQGFATSPISGRSYGTVGLAGNCTNGYNYGAVGALVGTTNGCGVFGGITTDYIVWDKSICIPGRYAGYFHGDVYSTGGITAPSFNVSSDYNLKTNIQSVEDGTLNKLMDMNVVSYNYKQREYEMPDTATTACKYYEEDSPTLKNKHYGLIAQELQELYPDLVTKGQDGYLTINYIELIPIMIQSIQELTDKIETMQMGNEIRKDATAIETILSDKTALAQNDPNPFTEVTLISCSVAETVRTASIFIYDMNGKQLAEYPICTRGDSAITIKGESLEAGMYFYSLIADGKLIDTKRMILTK